MTTSVFGPRGPRTGLGVRVGLLGLLVGLLALPAVAADAPAPGAAAKPRVKSVTFSIRHRVFHDFRDLQTVRLNEDFILGDTEYRARIVRYVPEFEMDLATRRVVSRSDQPRNPAFEVVVRKGNVPQDTSWAFLNMPPHFGRRAYFAFHVVRIDFTGHEPMLADTVSAAAADSAARAAAGAAHPPAGAGFPAPPLPPSHAAGGGMAPAHRDTTRR
jgi:hypothetical protein